MLYWTWHYLIFLLIYWFSCYLSCLWNPSGHLWFCLFFFFFSISSSVTFAKYAAVSFLPLLLIVLCAACIAFRSSWRLAQHPPALLLLWAKDWCCCWTWPLAHSWTLFSTQNNSLLPILRRTWSKVLHELYQVVVCSLSEDFTEIFKYSQLIGCKPLTSAGVFCCLPAVFIIIL